MIIHDLVPEDNPDWELFSDLMKIVDIVISPVIARQTTYYLQVFIKEYLEEFKNLYPNTRLIPKKHFMVHYPTQIRRYVTARAPRGILASIFQVGCDQLCGRFMAGTHRLFHGVKATFSQ
jgi:hypothetical protein